MAELKGIKTVKKVAKKGIDKIDTDKIKENTAKVTGVVIDKAGDLKDATLDLKDDIVDKITELDQMLSQEITNYNDAFTQMNDKGIQLYVERSKAADNLVYVEKLVNSIANRPKEFDREFEEIAVNKKSFTDACEFADKELLAAREAAGGAGAGIAAGASVAFMGPTAAMWVATTFGTASTGTAISSLSGAAATKAALAWLGGGALSTGGGGIAAGNALLAMAGPIGWSIAGATLLTSIVLFANKKTKLNKEKNEEIDSVKKNTEAVKEIDAEIAELLKSTREYKDGLLNQYDACFALSGGDYSTFTADEKKKLGALVNNAKGLSALFSKTVGNGTEK